MEKSFKKNDLLKDFNIYQYPHQYVIHNKNVYIVIKNIENSKLDLDRFYSRVAIPGYARCSLYYMLKDIIEKLDNIDENTEIGITIIAPSEPRRTMESIKKTYNNLGFSKIECTNCKGITKKEYQNLIAKNPEMIGSDEYLCKDTELCSAKFEKISKILNTLKFCDENENTNISRKRSVAIRDSLAAKHHKGSILTDEDITDAKDYDGPLLTDEDLKDVSIKKAQGLLKKNYTRKKLFMRRKTPIRRKKPIKKKRPTKKK